MDVRFRGESDEHKDKCVDLPQNIYTALANSIEGPENTVHGVYTTSVGQVINPFCCYNKYL